MNEKKNSTIYQRAGKGFVYTGIFGTFGKLISVFQLSVLARLLSPDDFGINSLASVLLTAAATFTAFGAEKLIIQRKSLDEQFLGTAWSAILLRGFLISSVCVMLAPLYGKWTENPAVTPILVIVSIGPFVSSLASPFKFVSERNLEFKRLIFFEFWTDVLAFVVLSSLAYLLRSVFALAIGTLVMAFSRSAISWLWFHGWVRPRFNTVCLKEILGFGRHFFIITLGTFVMAQCDNLFVGKVLGATVLGYYALGYRISQLVIDILNMVLGRVAFPLFSKLQINQRQLRQTFLNVFSLQMMLIFPLLGFTLIFSEMIVTVFLGKDYYSVVPILKSMTFLMLGRGISHTLVPMIFGVGKFSFASKIKFIETTIFLIGIAFGGYFFNVIGVAIGAGIGYFVAASFRVGFVMQVLKISTRDMAKLIFIPSMITLTASLFTFLIKRSGFISGYFVNPALSILVFLGTTIILQIALHRQKALEGIKFFSQPLEK